MKILIVGSGGREHALAWALSRSPQVTHIFVAPGNAGTVWDKTPKVQGMSYGAPSENVTIKADDVFALRHFAQQNHIDLTIVGPEIPLSMGIVDAFQAVDLKIFGATQAACRLESSKAFSKDFMVKNGIPTANYHVSDNLALAKEYILQQPPALVVKADGLAAGKGVIVADSHEESLQAVEQIMQEKIFGDAGQTVLLEERLYGREFSVLAFCDGKIAKPMVVARDHKRAYDGDTGPNTGGMGAIAPAADIADELIHEVVERVLMPTLHGMAQEGTPYIGVLYAGLMLTDTSIQVLEFNCRFGDPEAQVILPLLKTDLVEVILACIEGQLDQIAIEWHNQYCATVVAASGGYPNNYPRDIPIYGLEDIQERTDGIAFHSGTAFYGDQIVTSGGRVLAITGMGDTLETAIQSAYALLDNIHFDGLHYRTDIGRT